MTVLFSLTIRSVKYYPKCLNWALLNIEENRGEIFSTKPGNFTIGNIIISPSLG